MSYIYLIIFKKVIINYIIKEIRFNSKTIEERNIDEITSIILYSILT